jgi:hypothetical protein
MPGYGILEANKGQGLLPWSWAQERLAKSHNYFVSTVRPDGRPHTMPVWGVWVDDRFYFSTGRQSRKARNLATNAACVVCTERADEAAVVEGVAEEVGKVSSIPHVARAYHRKYKWKLDPSLGPIFGVRPRVALGFIEHDAQFISTATRWTFQGK